MSVVKGESPDYLSAFNTLESATFIVSLQPSTRVRFRLAWASQLYLSRSFTTGPVRHYALLPLSFVPQIEHTKNQKEPLFLGRAQKSLSSIFSALFLIVAWDTIHAYV